MAALSPENFMPGKKTKLSFVVTPSNSGTSYAGALARSSGIDVAEFEGIGLVPPKDNFIFFLNVWLAETPPAMTMDLVSG